MQHRNSLILVTVLVMAEISLAGTWMASPGKGNHAAGGGATAALRSSSNTTYASRASTVITAPTGIQNGDILIIAIFAFMSAGHPTLTLPAGFTTIQGPSEVPLGGDYLGRVLGYKVASGESGSYTVTQGGTYSTQGIMLCVSGASSSTPVSSNTSSEDLGSGGTTTATGITTPSNNSLVAFIAHNNVGYTGVASPPSGTTPTFTEVLDSGLSYVATGILATAGATGDKTHANGNGGGDGWAVFLVACGP